MQLLGVAGSLRRGSYNRQLLRAAEGLLPPGVELGHFEGLKAVPPFDEDDELSPDPGARAWLEAVDRADGILFATPEYNESVPGQLKNAIDWASRPVADAALRNKPVAVVGASTGMFGAVWAQAELRKALGAAGARVLRRELPVSNADEAFTSADEFADAELALELGGILAELAELVERRRARQARPDA